MPDIPLLVPFLVAACFFSPLVLSLLEIEQDSDSRDDTNPPGGVTPTAPRPVGGDSHAVKIEQVDLAPSLDLDTARADRRAHATLSP